ncbi:MAG: type 1 glutamine amidotransferase [Acidimicrobiales bacterium]
MPERESTVRIVVVHPDLLGTYGDGGNGLILARRLEWRGFAVELIEAMSGTPVPASGDIYCLGGGEDAAQHRAAAELAEGDPLGQAVDNGAAVLAVCAGFQILGHRYPSADGMVRDGLGLIDIVTFKGTGRRPVGELVVTPSPSLGLPQLTGYENHGGLTSLGPGAAPLGRVDAGIGNGAGDGSEGAVVGRVIGTYMHGPVLARNPALADLILISVVGALEPLDDSEAESLRHERLGSVSATSSLSRWSERLTSLR